MAFQAGGGILVGARPLCDLCVGCFPVGGRPSELVEREPSDHRGQERLGISDVPLLGAVPTNPGLLNDVFGIRRRSKDTVGHAHQVTSAPLECVHRGGGSGITAYAHDDGAVAASTCWAKMVGWSWLRST